MMGSVNDPKDGKAAARTVFAAVLVYVVCPTFLDLNGSSPQPRFPHFPIDSRKAMEWPGALTIFPVRTGVPGILRVPGISALEATQSW